MSNNKTLRLFIDIRDVIKEQVVSELASTSLTHDDKRTLSLKVEKILITQFNTIIDKVQSEM
jgi:hypothetical protein